MDLQTLITSALGPSPWDVGNEVLYALCRTKPAHTSEDEVIAKVWLIGRAYAAAIERRLNKTEENDIFYVKSVGPKIVKSEIDAWLKDARRYDKPSVESLPIMLKVHHQTTQLFEQISGLAKRSLASKYLHFHCPQLFFIYDTRAVEALQLPYLRELISHPMRLGAMVDNDFSIFAGKCLSLQMHIHREFGIDINPRQLDSLLLKAHENRQELALASK